MASPLISGVSVILLLLAGLVPGWLITRQFAGSSRPTLLTAFAALTLGIGLVGWLALVLAELGAFSIGMLAVLCALASALLVALELWRKQALRWPPPADLTEVGIATPIFPGLPHWAERVFLIIWLIAAAWLFARPHEYIAGASDAGVYVNLAASIASEGSIVLSDDLLAGLDPALYPATLRPLPDDPVAPYYLVPGFYVIGDTPGEVTPQFYPLHPVWQAAAGGLASGFTGNTLAGVQASLLMTGLWAALGALAVYFVVRQFAGWETSALALTALTITGLQVWFARYPTTEMLTQYLLWAGLLGLGLWMGGDRPGKLWALLAGVTLGQVYLVRIDMLVLLPVFALLVVVLLAGGRRGIVDRRTIPWFVVPLVLLVVHSFVHAWQQSRPYFVTHIGLGLQLLWTNWLIPVAAFAAAAVVLWLVWRAGPAVVASYDRNRRAALAMLVGVAVVFAAYGYFVRPVLGDTLLRQDIYSQVEIPLTDYDNWPRLAWYITPAGIWLGVAGICLLIWRVNRRTVMLVATGALFTALYMWSLRANPHHVYAMRRLVPAVLPFLTVAAAAFIGWLARNERQVVRLLAAGLAVVWLAGLAWSGRGLAQQVDYQGFATQLAAFSETLEPDSVLLFNDPAIIGQGDFFGTPLRFIFGHSVLSVRDQEQLPAGILAETVQGWQNEGRTVYSIGDTAWLEGLGLAYQPDLHTLKSQHLEHSYEHKPAAIQEVEWPLLVARLAPVGQQGEQ